ncbi:hypothetical protein [Streptomyces sp. NPDC058678]|uniref:hypothetical protein n=1 Tax=Streptomyces sp. NPDC058678 TaxID=3346595 RepID=UPI0036669C93
MGGHRETLVVPGTSVPHRGGRVGPCAPSAALTLMPEVMAMSSEHEKSDGNAQAEGTADERRPHRMRIPGFVIGDEEVGLGDVVKRVTYAAGIRPCGGCERRAAALNQWVAFSNRRDRW